MGVSSAELHSVTGAGHLDVGLGAGLLDARTLRERPAVVRRAQGEPHLAKGDTKSDISLMRIADGIGTLSNDKAPTASRRLNRELRRRLVSQDVATVVLLLFAFAITVLVSCLNIYHFADDPSPVVFYSDPKLFQQRLLCTSAEPAAFLRAFNVQPSAARLRILGARSGQEVQVGRVSNIIRTNFVRRFSAGSALTSDRRLPRARREEGVIFDVALDLTPFISGEGRLSSDTDLAVLEKHISSSNPLEVLCLCKKVEWMGWEDVATNIRQHLRSLGFQGSIEVRLEAREEMLIYRNHPWQNFVRNRITQCLVVLSVVGALFWVPYLWIRMRTVRVESKFEIHLHLERYWELLADGLHEQDGFRGAGLAR